MAVPGKRSEWSNRNLHTYLFKPMIKVYRYCVYIATISVNSIGVHILAEWQWCFTQKQQQVLQEVEYVHVCRSTCTLSKEAGIEGCNRTSILN